MERFAIKIDKKLKANLYKICRLCGIDNPDMVPILSDKQDSMENAAVDVEAEMEMYQKINLLIGLSVTKDDRMPQTMCCLCVDKINDFYEFREMCYATNAQTRKLLGLKNVKKPPVDIKPKVEVKEESIVPTPINVPTPAANKNGNRKRKSEEVTLKEEPPAAPVTFPKKKLRFSTPAEPTVKEEAPVAIKKKLRFTALNDEPMPPAASSTKKSKNALIEDTKLKKDPSPPVVFPPPAVSNKKLRLAAPPQKELATKKSKQKGGKNADQKDVDVKEEIKEEIKEEPLPAAAPTPKLKFGCNICKERFAAKVNLETHTRSTHLPKIERYVCTACNEVLGKSFDIKNHQLWHKLSKTPYVCGCCGESILNTYAFSRHLREHAFETPPALLVLDRECPQCHTSYATNFLYNIHTCAVRTKRCAGCNRLQRNEAEYLKHSAQCAKVYLNYSKHIMPSVEALEDAVRIKNENDVEAAAEEMARLGGVPLDMAPVVQLTRLSSPLIMAANQCVSGTGLDDAASTSSRKSGKKGVSKKDLKRVDELLKSTLDALVSIKHEPEVHVEQETPCAGEHSDNDDHNDGSHPDDHDVGGLDDFHHNDDDSDNENEAAHRATETSAASDTTAMEQIKIKQEIDETNEENANKIGGGGLKLKIKKEHGQLNSSIIEQQKSSDKRAEKRKKKKKHKDKEKDKQKLPKDMQDEQVSQDSNVNNNGEETVGTTPATIRIKVEPQDGADAADITSVATAVQVRPQPEATIMTSIPMMQFQIACVTSGVEFNSGAASAIAEAPTVPTVPTVPANHDAEPEDVKPNREELDRMLKIAHVSSGIAMETDATGETEDQPMDHDGNDDEGNGGDEDEVETDYHEEEDDHHENNDNESEHQVDNQSDHRDDEHEVDAEEAQEAEDENDKDLDRTSEDTGIDNEEIIAKKIKKPLLKPKSTLTLKPKSKPTPTVAKSRNKACKSTAKPPNMPVLQISAVRSGVALEPSAPSASDFTPIFIKPEPQNRGYSDEQPSVEEPPPLAEIPEPQEEAAEEAQSHSPEEQNYISSIDFNNITIKQEKDIEINDVQVAQKSHKSFADLNGIKRKRKTVRRAHAIKDKTSKKVEEETENNDENIEADEAEYDEHDTDDEAEEEEDDEEVEEEEEEEEEAEEEEDEDEDEEEEEEREYRELEYPPELCEKNAEIVTEVKTVDNNRNLDDDQKSKLENVSVKEDSQATNQVVESNMTTLEPTNEMPSFVITSVCSHAPAVPTDAADQSTNDLHNLEPKEVLTNRNENLLTAATVSEANVSVMKPHSEENPNNTQTLEHISPNENAMPVLKHDCDIVNAETSTVTQGDHGPHVSVVAGPSQNSDIAIADPSTQIPKVSLTHTDLNTTIVSNENNTHPLPPPTLPTPAMPVNEMSLQIGQPFEVQSDGQIAQPLNPSLEQNISDSNIESPQVTNSSGVPLQCPGPLTQDQLSMSLGIQLNECPQVLQANLEHELRQESHGPYQATQDILQCAEQSILNSQLISQQNPQSVVAESGTEAQIIQECERTDSQELQDVEQETPALDQQQQQQQPHSLSIFEHSAHSDAPHTGQLLDDLQSTHNLESQPQTSQNLQPVFKISAVTSAATEFSNNPLSNSDDRETLQDNQEGTATIEGVVEQAKDLNLQAQPVTENLQRFNHETADDNEMDVDENYENEDEEDENELEDEDNGLDDDTALCSNLEQRQNYQNQEVLTQIRPAALALHPYLEDISSSSNSLLSNSLSQTPPPPSQPTSSSTRTCPAGAEQRRLLNTEETENILNESNDALSRRSSGVAASAALPLAPAHLAQQLPPHMPTFNFDNINEIAENNNNANIEREQLQDEQQQQQQQQNQQHTTNTQ